MPYSSRSKTNLTTGSYWLLVLLFVFSPLPLKAQKSAESTKPPKYDLETESKTKGIIEEVKLPPKGSERDVAHLMVKSGDSIVDVYLCPGSFLDDMGVRFSKGDEISLTGSKVKQGDTDLVLAREVAKGTDTLVLRDEKGKPVW